MNNTSGIYIHSQTALPKEYSKLLKEGSSVFVRILKQSSPNTYIASFAGGRFPLKSAKPLMPGSTFMAKISFTDGKLNLTKIENTAEKIEKNNQTIIQHFSDLSPEVSELLMNIGLPQDSVSKILLQTMVMSGAKLNLEKMNKARNAALKFPGQEDEAAEAALILLDKGIEPTFENIQSVMMNFNFGENSDEKKSREKISNSEIDELEKELKNFFTDLFNYENNGNPVEQAPGFLTVFNHFASKNDREVENHWLLIPFEFGFEKEEKYNSGSGVFRVFLDIIGKKVKKTVISFTFNGEISTFVLHFCGNHLKEINFCKIPAMTEEKSEAYGKRLSTLFEGVSVKAQSYDVLCGFADGDELLPVVKGFA